MAIDINAALDAIENSDPVAELAARLIAEGLSEVELQRALGERSRSPLGIELRNKYRDISMSGWTINGFQKCHIWKR